MTNWHGYLLITSLPAGWTNEQRQVAWQAMRGLGDQSNLQPAKTNHSRLRLDDRAMIVEAEFDESEIIREAIVDMLAIALNVNPMAIDAVIDYQIFAESEAWEQSRQAVVNYLITNAVAWGDNE